MALTGSEAVLAAALQGSIESEIASFCGSAPVSPNCIDGLASGIAKALIPHLVANIEVLAGQSVTTAVAPHVPGGPAVGSGSVTSNGVIT